MTAGWALPIVRGRTGKSRSFHVGAKVTNDTSVARFPLPAVEALSYAYEYLQVSHHASHCAESRPPFRSSQDGCLGSLTLDPFMAAMIKKVNDQKVRREKLWQSRKSYPDAYAGPLA
jgi:hypothetical protein